MPKFITAQEAAALIPDHATVGVCGMGLAGWPEEIACAIRDLSGNVCDIRPCHSDEFPSKVRRPHFSVLDKTKVKETFGVEVPHWYVSLQKCIDRL